MSVVPAAPDTLAGLAVVRRFVPPMVERAPSPRESASTSGLPISVLPAHPGSSPQPQSVLERAARIDRMEVESSETPVGGHDAGVTGYAGHAARFVTPILTREGGPAGPWGPVMRMGDGHRLEEGESTEAPASIGKASMPAIGAPLARAVAPPVSMAVAQAIAPSTSMPVARFVAPVTDMAVARAIAPVARMAARGQDGHLARGQDGHLARGEAAAGRPPIARTSERELIHAPSADEASAGAAAPLSSENGSVQRVSWGGLPAPWEPLPGWLAAPSGSASPQEPAPVERALQSESGGPSVAPGPTGTGETMAPARRAPRAAPAAAPARAAGAAPHGAAAPVEPDLDALARQVFGILQRRLAAERRRAH